MTDPHVQPGDLRSLWQAMPTTPVTISADEMRARALAFDRKIRRRNLTEYVAAVFVVGVFGWYATFPEPATPLWPIANLMIIAGVMLITWNLNRIARAATPPAHATATGLIAFQREQITRQRDALKSVWLWYIAPVVPGIVVWFIAVAVGTSDTTPMALAVGLGGSVLVCALVFGLIILVNLVGAARLQRMIEDLDRLGEQ
jgi:hypothetical protein